MIGHIGQQLGNYRLIRLLGRGGFAEVYLGRHIHLDTEAAIKVLMTQLEISAVEQFRDEARLIARLVHPHIVRVLEFGVEGTMPFLVMDFAPGGTLRQRHPKGSRLPLSMVVSYVQQIAPALDYIHGHRLIHRDIKPENLLVGRNKEILLSDLGIAVFASTHKQSERNIAGTIKYMAPEQINGYPQPASDQYALGILVYEWLSGEWPFHGSFIEVAAKHTMALPPSLREKMPHLPPMVEQVVLTALAKDPNRRFASVGAFATALQQASRVSPDPAFFTDSTPHTTNPDLSNQASSDRAFFTGSTSHTTNPDLNNWASSDRAFFRDSTAHPTNPDLNNQAFSGPAFFTDSAPHRTNTPTEASSSGQNAQFRLPPDETAFTVTMTSFSEGSAKRPGQRLFSRRTVAAGLAGLTLVGAASAGFFWFTHSQRFAVRVSSLSAPPSIGTLLYTYHGHPETIYATVWSPDGQRIASASRDKTVQIWHASDGQHVLTYRRHSSYVYMLAQSLDGSRIASASADKTVQVWSPADGQEVFTYRQHSNFVYAVAWSPNGQRIASGGWDKTVQVWNAVDGSHVFVYHGHSSYVHTVAWSPDGQHIASGSDDGLVQVWNARDGSHIFTYRQHTAPVIAVAWSLDGQRIASASHDETVQIWNATDGSHVFTYRGHAAAVITLAWSPNGQRIVSGSRDKTAQVWNAADGSNAFIYRKHTDWVTAVAWSPDGKRIASGSASGDSTVQVWKAV
jgi:eukaryotic-like serine/threonine-protein kinase